VKLRAGTLYSALDRLAAEHLIEADREEVVDGRHATAIGEPDEGPVQSPF
jgi:DNA-binding PadR family transcriptional regulator